LVIAKKILSGWKQKIISVPFPFFAFCDISAAVGTHRRPIAFLYLPASGLNSRAPLFAEKAG
jgi:hypothetical protein